MILETICRLLSAGIAAFSLWSWFIVIRQYKAFVDMPDRGYRGRFNGEKSSWILLKDGRKIPVLGLVWFFILALLANWAAWFKI